MAGAQQQKLSSVVSVAQVAEQLDPDITIKCFGQSTRTAEGAATV